MMQVRSLAAWLFTICCLIQTALSVCDEPSPAFAPPYLDRNSYELGTAAASIVKSIKHRLISQSKYANTSFSVEVTSATETLFSFHHTAKHRSLKRRGASVIDNTTNYRIASMTKPFTVLAILQQHKAGNLSLDDAVLKYLPALGGPQNGSLPWKDITLRALASQIAGLPRDFAQTDLSSQPDVAARLGLPTTSPTGVPQCDSSVDFARSCTAEDLIEFVKQLQPLYAPNQKSSYSNINYDLLGLVIAKVTGVSYEDYVEYAILKDIGMDGSGFKTPEDSVAAIPAGQEWYWDIQMGTNNPTGGMYSSSGDLSKFLRFALTGFNAQTHALNWFQPTSWSDSSQTFYGMPWEIYRTRPLEKSSRPVSFITKGGGLPGYTSDISMVPEYGFGITVLVAGRGSAVSILRDIVTKEVLRAAETLAQKELHNDYAGRYAAHPDSALNSSVTIESSPEHGLVLKSLISNGTDTLAALRELYLADRPQKPIFRIIPTELHVDEKNQAGERWRLHIEGSPDVDDGLGSGLFDNFCVADVDVLSYGGKPVNEIVFWSRSPGKEADRVTLTAFEAELVREKKGHGHDGALAYQDPTGRN